MNYPSVFLIVKQIAVEGWALFKGLFSSAVAGLLFSAVVAWMFFMGVATVVIIGLMPYAFYRLAVALASL